jgi:hypothetical protein
MCCVGIGAAAQSLPADPISLASGRVVLGGEAAASTGSADDGFFNYSDYQHSTLREFRVGLTALVRASDRVSFLGEFRSENLGHVSPYAAYARVRPFPRRRLDIQIGRIPPTFGRFARQAYGRDNALIGYPLAYQYLTSLRPDALPATADELLTMRARGWRSSFSVGNGTAARGVPLVTAFTWDTGVQVTTGWKALGITTAVTNGTASSPRVADDNRGKQIAARVTLAISPGLSIGSSFARGAFVASEVLRTIGHDGDSRYVQRADGADVEYARGHLVARAEAVLSRWTIPFAAQAATAPAPRSLRAAAFSGEARYMLLPGVYAAARLDHLGFSRIAGTARTLPWDAPVSRVEVGGGYYLQRNLVARASWQANRRAAGRVTSSHLVSAQLLYWF